MTKREADAAIAQAVKAALYKDLPRWLMETADANEFNLPDLSVYEAQADMYRRLSWVLSACEISGQYAATTKFNVGRVIGDKEPKDIPNHPFESLLERPNPLDSRTEFIASTFISHKLTGNAYWWLNRESQMDAPEEMWFIPSHMIQPIPDGNLYLRGYYYYPGNGVEMILEPHEIVHYRRFNPFNRFIGLSALEAIAWSARGDLEQQEWSTNFYGKNNARLPGILTFEQMIEQGTWDKIKADTREASEKRQLLMLRGVGQGGVNWLQNAVSQKDMEFLEARRFTKEEIWTVLAPGLFSMLSENSTEANSKTGAVSFDRLTVYPMHVMMAEKITNEILPAYGSEKARRLVGQFEDVRGEDRELVLREQEEYSKTHTVDEIRTEKYGDDPIGDERGKLFVSQINAQSGGIQEPPAPPTVPGQPAQDKEPAKPEPEEEERPVAKLVSEELFRELARYERFTKNRLSAAKGKHEQFTTRLIPADIMEYLNKKLPTCKNATEVAGVFDGARARVQTAPSHAVDPLLVLRGIEAGVKALEMQKG
jgi:HK97 family phage portal protein